MGRLMTEELIYQIPKGENSRSIEAKIEKVISGSSSDLKRLLEEHQIPTSIVAEISGPPFGVSEKGAGFGAETIALLVSLAPLVEKLTPLLKPFVDAAADVAKQIALDYWEHTRRALWEHEHVQLKAKMQDQPTDS
jgi:hypothetical protein